MKRPPSPTTSQATPPQGTRPLRRLMPSDGSRATPPPAPLPKKIDPVIAACNDCRRSKVKCSGERPACKRCVKRQVTCQYVARLGETRQQAITRHRYTTRSGASVHQQLLEVLTRLPDHDALAVLQKVRAGEDLSAVLSHVEAGDVLGQLALEPETRFRYTFPYRTEMPEMCARNNPYLGSLVYEAAALYGAAGAPASSFLARGSASSASSSDAVATQNLYLKPFHAAHVMEPLLTDAKPSEWTTVCADDMLMRNLLRAFLRCEYQFTAAFHKDLFLEDMAAQRTDFCSPMLVNVVLAHACVCYDQFSDRAEYWNPHTLMYRFLAEAKRLWEIEATVAEIPTIQAGIIFSVVHNLCGLDEIGQPYRIQAVALAHTLRLFDGIVEGQDERMKHGREYTAWALYNWETLVAFSFVHAPLVKTPPNWPLPDPSENPGWYGEIWVRYPLDQDLVPIHNGHYFRSRCLFRITMNEVCEAAYSKDSEITMQMAYAFLRRLQDWYGSLPQPLLPRNIVHPSHLQLHMYYCHLILTIFQPLCDTQTTRDPSPQQIVAESRNWLQTILRLYYLRHGFEAMDLFIVIPLVLTGSDCLDAIEGQSEGPELEILRSTLILVAMGLYSQRRNHYLAEALFRVVRGRMRPQEFALFKGTVSFDEKEADKRRDMAQAVRSHWPVSVVKKKEDLESHILTNLVENYASLNVQETEEDDDGKVT